MEVFPGATTVRRRSYAEDEGGIFLLFVLIFKIFFLLLTEGDLALCCTLQNPNTASLDQILLSALMENIYRLIQISYRRSLFTI